MKKIIYSLSVATILASGVANASDNKVFVGGSINGSQDIYKVKNKKSATFSQNFLTEGSSATDGAAEYAAISTNATDGYNMQGSLLAGYTRTINMFVLGAELGMDFGRVSIGDNGKQELKMTSSHGFYGLIRAGVNVPNSSATVYLQTGINARDYKMKYLGEFIASQSTKNIVSAVYGIGGEYKMLNETVGIFGEYNFMSSINKFSGEALVKKVNIRSHQIKVGARYYFDI